MAKRPSPKARQKRPTAAARRAALDRIEGNPSCLKIRYDRPYNNILAHLRQGGKLARATGDPIQIPPHIEHAMNFEDLPYRMVRKTPPSKWWCYPTPNPAAAEQNFYRKRDNTFWQLPVEGFWTRDEAEFFLCSRGSYSGPVPLLNLCLEPADQRPVFEEFCRREDVGEPPESGFFAARSGRLARGLDPQAISGVLSGEFEWQRVINSANGKRWHHFEGDRIKNPKLLLWEIAREVLEAVREVHPDLSLSCLRSVLQSWQLFDHFFDVCCRLMRTDPSRNWLVVDNARDYIWGGLGQFAEDVSAIPDAALVGKTSANQDEVQIEIVGATDETNRRTEVLVGERKIELLPSELAIFLRLMIGRRETSEGWVHVDQFVDDYSAENDGSARQNINRLKKPELRPFIENKRPKQYRLTIPFAAIRYNKSFLLRHEQPKVRQLANLLP